VCATPIPGRQLWGALVAILVRPWLWWTALRQLARIAPRAWWRHPPFLPVPDAGYLRFRLETQYGSAGASATVPDDVVTYLKWCRESGR
jgi:hypothetical protein